MKKMSFALAFANRGFMPGELIVEAREEMIRAVTEAGYDYAAVQKRVNEIVDNLASIKVGDKVKCASNAKTYADGKTAIPAWVKSSVLYVRKIEDGGKVYLVSTEKTKPVYTGRLKSSDVIKIL